ncbi:hypothetical protein PIB30_086708 [Stylosanthes scabra]|uniref:Uncharacterized protein n=1 Tax=Stylosanthes scabra TaxID=79078 RepID=A0ABU6TW44_9FABA|nr:hypothetical protein [Stylosanthes scabra]
MVFYVGRVVHEAKEVKVEAITLVRRKKLAVFVSGGGSNFKSIHEASLKGSLHGDVLVSLKRWTLTCDVNMLAWPLTATWTTRNGQSSIFHTQNRQNYVVLSVRGFSYRVRRAFSSPISLVLPQTPWEATEKCGLPQTAMGEEVE